MSEVLRVLIDQQIEMTEIDAELAQSLIDGFDNSINHLNSVFNLDTNKFLPHAMDYSASLVAARDALQQYQTACGLLVEDYRKMRKRFE
jgi:hypothetical protein